MNNSGVSSESGVATSERNYHDQTVGDIENQNMPGVAAAPPPLIPQLPHTIHGSQTSEVELMYKAALEGDWAAAEKLLETNPTLAYIERICYLPDKESGNWSRPVHVAADEETEGKWYRPLHVAVALKHDKFARKLIEKMKPEDLELNESNKVGSCSYAAAHGMLDIAKTMIKKHPNILKHGETYQVLTMFAGLSGKSKVVSYFLEKTGEPDPDWEEAWLALLQNAIRSKMYGMALKILKKDTSFAIKRTVKGTALHVLARQNISAATTGKTALMFKTVFGTTFEGWQGGGKMPPDFRSLAKNLLDEIQKMEKSSAFELLKNPPILHDAAKVGNVDLIRMITREYPDLIWQTDDKGRSLISIAIEYREANVFSFIQRFRALDKISILFGKVSDETNLLHLAAKLGPRKNAIPALQMQGELAWFKAVEDMLPLQVTEQTENGKTPRKVFEEEHKKLLKESKAWMKSTSDSCMLIATIILTVVYAAAFTVPGGNSEATGLPIRVKSNWLTCFFIFEALALFSSTLCIITFWSITCSGFEEDQFFDILPYQLRLGFTALFGSLIGAIAAFMSAYHIVLVQGKAWLVKSFLLLICVILVFAILGRFWELWSKIKLPKSLPQNLGGRPIPNQHNPSP
ncbi:hypothetical protein C2S51_006601 [Perilla frutescens var. frutescens]|nr:hypothetical protein C2S51_006601 [Perilla frutescens var. frutescens]